MNPLQPSGTLITAAGRAHYQRQPETDEVLVTLHDGRQLRVAADLISPQADGQQFLNLTRGEIEARVQPAHTPEALVVPVVEEDVAVGVRAVETGRVRVSKVVHEVDEAVETWLARDEVEVERVPVNEFVEGAGPIEYGDDRVVVPIYEEVVVVEKRLRLKEKLVITRRRQTERDVQPVTRRVEEARVERLPPEGGGAPAETRGS